jgi:hypothetical protein
VGAVWEVGGVLIAKRAVAGAAGVVVEERRLNLVIGVALAVLSC